MLIKGSVLRMENAAQRGPSATGIGSRAWDTPVGTMDLHIPKLREGSFPSLLELRRRRASSAGCAAGLRGRVSTRREMDDLVKALGCEGISKSQVSRICQELDVVVDGFMGRPLDAEPYPYLWLDALTQKEAGPRDSTSPWSVATAVNGEGKRGSSGWTWVRVKTAPSGWPSCARCPPGASAGWSWCIWTLIRDSAAQSPQSSADPVGRSRTHFMTTCSAGP